MLKFMVTKVFSGVPIASAILMAWWMLEAGFRLM